MELGLRRTLMLALGGVAIAALLVAVLVTAFAVQSAGVWLGVAVALVVLALVGEVLLLVFGEREPREPHKSGHPEVHLGPSAPARVAANLLLRCSACAKTFSAHDDGHRPLATLCPHCGQRGVIESPAA